MLVSRISPISGKEHILDLPICQEEIDRWQNGELIQNAFPTLSADEREFFKTGVIPGEWEEAFGDGSLDTHQE